MENESIYDNNANRNVIVKTKKTDEEKTIYTSLKDEFGFYTDRYRAKTTYPKGSRKILKL